MLARIDVPPNSPALGFQFPKRFCPFLPGTCLRSALRLTDSAPASNQDIEFLQSLNRHDLRRFSGWVVGQAVENDAQRKASDPKGSLQARWKTHCLLLNGFFRWEVDLADDCDKKKFAERADKPGFVVDDHFSGPPITRRL